MTPHTKNAELDLSSEPLRNGLVVQANAGTGKTYSITALVAREVSATAHLGAAATAVEDFLIVTFTNNAASDLRVRVREQLSDLRAALLEPIVATPSGFTDRHRANIDGHRQEALLAVEKALGSLDRAAISTIHQFCGTVLRLAGIPLTEVVEDRVVDEVLLAVANDSIVSHTEARMPTARLVSAEKLKTFLKVLMSNPDVDLEGLTIEDPAEAAELVNQVAQARDEVCRRLAKSLTHDETIRRTFELLRTSRSGDGLLLQQVRSMYRYCIIDESQDTDKVQWQLFKLLFPDDADDGRALVVVGDPKQSIYAFRGADIGAYLEETSSRSASLIRELTTNYRSDDRLIRALNALLAGSTYGDGPEGMVIDYRAVNSNRPPTEIHFKGVPAEPIELVVVDTTNQDGLIRDTVKQVSSLLSGEYSVKGRVRHQAPGMIPISDEEIRPKDIAILVKSGPLGRKIQQALLEVSIPAVSNSTESVASGSTFEALSHLAAAFDRPSDDGLTRRVAMSAFFDVPGRDQRLLSESFLTALQQTLNVWHHALTSQGIGALASLILSDRIVRLRFLATRQGERHLTDFNQIIEYVEDTTNGQPISARRLIEALQEIENTDHVSNEIAARRIESDDDAVQISTIHSSKGLQYPLVVVVDTWKEWTAQGLGPKIVRRGSASFPGRGRVMDVGYIIGNGITATSEGDAAAAFSRLKEDGNAEIKRLFYVAVTRAKHHVTVICPTKRSLAIRHQVDDTKKKKKSTPTSPTDVPPSFSGCFDLGTMDGSVPHEIPIGLQDLLRIGGREQHLRLQPRTRQTLVVSQALRAIDRTRERTSFSQIKKKLERPLSGSSHVFSADDFVRNDDEFLEAADEGDTGSHRLSEMKLWDLPKGKDFGTTLHFVLEHLDPTAHDLEAEVSRAVDAHVSPATLKKYRNDLIDGLVRAIRTPFGVMWRDCSLRDIPKSSRLEEARFDAKLSEGGLYSVPNTKAIGDFVFSTVAEEDPLREYGALLRSAPQGVALRGTLNGSIDALLHVSTEPHRFVVSDYKSNWLRDPSDVHPLERYSPENLWNAMTSNHYQLQALIYGVAAYRYLRSRGMSAVVADQSVAGFAYLFVRGLIGESQTPIQQGAQNPFFNGQRYGVSSWSSDPYPTFWSGLSEVILGAS